MEDVDDIPLTSEYPSDEDYSSFPHDPSYDDDDEESDAEPLAPPPKRKKGAHKERALRRWHLRTNVEITGDAAESGDLRQRLGDGCKHWCFQLELGKGTGRLHYQCRVSFDPPVRKSQVCTLFPDMHITPESTRGGDTGAGKLYVMKTDTRKDGPWSDKDVEVYKDPDYVLSTYRPWQQEMQDRLRDQDNRTILVVVDPEGNSGKTSMAHHLVQYHGGIFIPPFCDTGQMILEFACSFVKPGRKYTFVIDMPRALLMRHVAARLFAAFETLKGGYVYDHRYHGKYVYFQKPSIVVFTNVAPDSSLLTGDRWDVLTLPWTPTVAPAVSSISYAQGHPEVECLGPLHHTQSQGNP